MANYEVIAYSVASFICALFVLEFGADKFIDHTTIVAKRTGIAQGVIALLTAGAEWEELAVVVISIARHRSSLALGNIVGSTISNILGAFSLGLLFYRGDDEIVFDQSSKIYSALLLVLTALVAGLTGFGHEIMWRVVGCIAILVFIVYVASIAWIIYRGLITAPEGSDSDSSDDEDDHVPAQEVNATDSAPRINSADPFESTFDPGTMTEIANTETLPIMRNHQTSYSTLPRRTSALDSIRHSRQHSLSYHIVQLTIGILSVITSAYVLSHAASTLVREFGISDIVFGVVILSIATTIPEKFIAAVSGFKGQMGIMVANTVGSNIFLLSLCIGVLWVATDGNYNEGSVKPAEIGVMLGSAVVMFLTVWFGANWTRLIGAIMLVAYLAFLVLEFTIIHQV